MSFPTEGPGDRPTPTVTHAHPGAQSPAPASSASRVSPIAAPDRTSPAKTPLPKTSVWKGMLPGYCFSHTPWGPAKFSREGFLQLATCHLRAERGNCSRGPGVRMAPQTSLPTKRCFVRSANTWGAPGAGRARLPAPRTVARLCPPGSLGEIQAPSPAEAGGVSCRWPSSSLCHLPAPLASVSPPVERGRRN